jgi:hypothetical protein
MPEWSASRVLADFAAALWPAAGFAVALPPA